MCLRLADIDRRVGAVEGVEQFVAELADEILKAQGQRGGFRIDQLALYGLNVGDGGFDLGGHGDAPKKMGMHHPLRDDGMPLGGKKNRHAADGGWKCSLAGLPATQVWSELERQTDDRGIAPCIGDDADAQLTGDDVVRVKTFA
nr:hypothetical protein [Pseudomonas aeruginosa]